MPVKHEPIRRNSEDRPPKAAATFAPAPDCPRWLPLLLLASALFYPLLGYGIYLLIR